MRSGIPKTRSPTSRDAPTGHKLSKLCSFSFQSRRWAHIKRSVQNTMKKAIAILILVFGLVGCDRSKKLDEAAVRSWASSPEVLSRSTPSLYTDRDAKGHYLAVGNGDFLETPDGIDLGDSSALKTGFYVFPGKIRVADIDEAIYTMKNLERGSVHVD